MKSKHYPFTIALLIVTMIMISNVQGSTWKMMMVTTPKNPTSTSLIGFTIYTYTPDMKFAFKIFTMPKGNTCFVFLSVMPLNPVVYVNRTADANGIFKVTLNTTLAAGTYAIAIQQPGITNCFNLPITGA